MKRTLVTAFLLLTLSACAHIKEDHYFKSISLGGDRATNYFRLRVKANASFSSARYIAGFYDERAVDLFFNELKSAAGSKQLDTSKLFIDNQKSPGTSEVLQPLDPGQHGTFVMIFSTNADAVANTIGSFAESNVVADALTNLVNQDRIRDALKTEATLAVVQRQSASVLGELDGLFAHVPGHATPTKNTTEAGYS